MLIQQETQIDKLRDRLADVRKKREKAMAEKGAMARENPDLRENSMYDYWEMKEWTFTAQIRDLIKEIEELAKKAK